jgi:hypothetical protein
MKIIIRSPEIIDIENARNHLREILFATKSLNVLQSEVADLHELTSMIQKEKVTLEYLDKYIELAIKFKDKIDELSGLIEEVKSLMQKRIKEQGNVKNGT